MLDVIATMLGFAGAGLAGYLIHGAVRHDVYTAMRAEIERMKTERKLMASDLARASCDRDEWQLATKTARRMLDQARTDLFDAHRKIEEMEPMADLGRRRKAALDRQKNKIAA